MYAGRRRHQPSGVKHFTDAEKAAYYRNKYAAVASSAAVVAAKKRPSSASAYSKAVSTLPGATTPVVDDIPRPFPSLIKRSKPKSNDHTSAHETRGYSRPRGAIRTGGDVHKSRFNSITSLIEKDTKLNPGTFAAEMEKKLKDSSVYFQSILDPLQGAGAKIPDLTSTPTSTFQMVQRIALTAGSNGVCGIALPSPHYAAANVGASPANVYAGYQIADASSTAAAITWGAVQAWTGYTSFSTSVQVARTVSAGLYAEFQGTELQDSGQFTIGFVPGILVTPPSVTVASSSPYSSIVPINRNTPCIVRYLPQGFYDVGFLMPNGGSGPNTDSMYIVASGLPAGTEVLITFVGNYEFQPTRQSVNLIDIQPSPNDMIECSKVSQWCQEINSTGIVNAKYVDVTPSSVAAEKAEVAILQNAEDDSLGGLGMLGRILDFALPVLTTLLPALM